MRDEVDYSRFYYAYQKGPSSEGDIRPPTRPDEDKTDWEERRKKKEKSKRGKRGRKVLSTFFILLFSFGLVFFCADFFGKGFLTDAVERMFSGKTYEYHFVVKSASSRYTAYACSLDVRQGGGGGYIIGEEEYLVAYSVYTDKTTAIGVQMKNKDTEVYSVKFKTKDDFASEVDSLICELEKGISDWEKGTCNESELSALLRAEKETFESKSVTLDGQKKGLADLITDGLGGFDLSVTEKITQLTKLRYFLCCVVYSAQAVFS